MRLRPQSKSESTNNGYLIRFNEKSNQGDIYLGCEVLPTIDLALQAIKKAIANNDSDKITIEPHAYSEVTK